MRLSAIIFAVMVVCLAQAAPPIKFGQTDICVGDKTLHVQVADTPEALERGLMFRARVAPYDGMLFVFPKPQPVAFWMKNTLIPLEVGYFDSQNQLVEIYSMKAEDTTPIPSKSENILYALELPTGDFAKKGLKKGDILGYVRLPQKSLDTSIKVLQ